MALSQDNPFADLVPQDTKMSKDNPFADLVPEQKADSAPQQSEQEDQGPGAFMTGVMGFNRSIERGVEGVTHLATRGLSAVGFPGPDQALKQVHDSKEAALSQAEEQHPIAGAIGQAAGYGAQAAMSPSSSLSAGAGKYIASNTLSSAALAGAQYTDTPEESIKNAAVGGLIGGSVAGIFKGAQKVYEGLNKNNILKEAMGNIASKMVPDEIGAAQKSQAFYKANDNVSIPEDAFKDLMSNKSIAARVEAISKNPDLASSAAPINSLEKLNAVKRQLDSDLFNNTNASITGVSAKLSKDERQGIKVARDQIRETLVKNVPGYEDILKNDEARVLKANIDKALDKTSLAGEKDPPLSSVYNKLFNTREKQKDFIKAVKRTGGDEQYAKDVISVMSKVRKTKNSISTMDLLTGGLGYSLFGSAAPAALGALKLGRIVAPTVTKEWGNVMEGLGKGVVNPVLDSLLNTTSKGAGAASTQLMK